MKNQKKRIINQIVIITMLIIAVQGCAFSGHWVYASKGGIEAPHKMRYRPDGLVWIWNQEEPGEPIHPLDDPTVHKPSSVQGKTPRYAKPEDYIK